VVLSEAEVQVLALAAPGHTFSYDMSVELFELRKRLGSVGFAAVCVARVKAARTPWVAVVIAGVCFEIAHFLQRHQHWPVTDCLRVEGACLCSR
jgi:hypothetical protein